MLAFLTLVARLGFGVLSVLSSLLVRHTSTSIDKQQAAFERRADEKESVLAPGVPGRLNSLRPLFDGHPSRGTEYV